MTWTWADPNNRSWTRDQLLEYIDAAMGIICNAHPTQIVAGEDPPGASPGWAEAARRWIDAYPPEEQATP